MENCRETSLSAARLIDILFAFGGGTVVQYQILSVLPLSFEDSSILGKGSVRINLLQNSSFCDLRARLLANMGPLAA
jgi:hypothetical protein